MNLREQWDGAGERQAGESDDVQPRQRRGEALVVAQEPVAMSSSSCYIRCGPREVGVP